jgi:hypothetical protein
MGLLSTLGTIGGSLFGGPVGGAIGGALGGAFESNDAGNAAQAAAQQTANATNQATQLQREMWQAQQEQQKPWLQAGQTALNALTPLATNYQRFGMDQFQQDPGYAFRLSEGQKALDRQAAARGGLISGGALKAAQRYGQEMGSQEYQNAFNRYQTERNAQLNPLQSLAGVGQTAANTLGAAGQQYGANVGNAMLNQGYVQGNALIAGQQGRQSMYGNIGTALGKVTPEQWSSAGNALTSWLNPTYSGQGPEGYAP